MKCVTRHAVGFQQVHIRYPIAEIIFPYLSGIKLGLINLQFYMQEVEVFFSRMTYNERITADVIFNSLIINIKHNK